MTTAFKCRNFITAASFARRLLEMPEANSAGDVKVMATKVLQRSEKEGRNEVTLNYDERNPFVIDCAALSPIYRGSESIKCAYCHSHYSK